MTTTPIRSSDTPGIPTGLQRLLRRAAVDDDCRRALLARPAAIAAAADLTDRERAILRAVPPAQLAAMIAGVEPPAGTDRRRFLAASGAALLLGGVALTACPTLSCGGIGPDVPPDRDGGTDAVDDGGDDAGEDGPKRG